MFSGSSATLKLWVDPESGAPGDTRRAQRPKPKLPPPEGIGKTNGAKVGLTSRVRPQTGIKKQMVGMARGRGLTVTSPAKRHMLPLVGLTQKNLWVRRQAVWILTLAPS